MSRNIPWVGTSWKMNHTGASAVAYAQALRLAPIVATGLIQPFVIPPFPYIAGVVESLQGSPVLVGGQNMHWADDGAWTGEVSAPMLKDCGASLVEIGHSERRTHFNETDTTVALKVESALKHGLRPIVCIGDTKAECDAGQTAEALARQVTALLSRAPVTQQHNIIIAYEPVWSIGVGGSPADPAFVNEQHRLIRNLLHRAGSPDIAIIYGGSVSAANAASLVGQPHVDGLFIGRAALDVSSYIEIMTIVAETWREK